MAKARNPRGLMIEAERLFADIMRAHLEESALDLVDRVMRAYKNATPAGQINAIKGLKAKGAREYRTVMLEAMGETASDAIQAARKEVPGTGRVKLSVALDSWKVRVESLSHVQADKVIEQDEHGYYFAGVATAIEKLPAGLRKFLNAKAQLLVGQQFADLEKAIFFQYQSSVGTTDSDAVMNDDLAQAAVAFVEGNSPRAGASLLSSQVVNEARTAFFFDNEVLEQIDAFVFVNGDPVTDVCRDLEGTVFAKDDPNAFRYTPPLHWNCKSYIAPVPAGQLAQALKSRGQDKIEKLKPSTKKIEDQIQFSVEHLTKTAQCCDHWSHAQT